MKNLFQNLALAIIKNPLGRKIAKHSGWLSMAAFTSLILIPNTESSIMENILMIIILALANFCAFLSAFYQYNPKAAQLKKRLFEKGS